MGDKMYLNEVQQTIQTVATVLKIYEEFSGMIATVKSVEESDIETLARILKELKMLRLSSRRAKEDASILLDAYKNKKSVCGTVLARVLKYDSIPF